MPASSISILDSITKIQISAALSYAVPQKSYTTYKGSLAKIEKAPKCR